MIENNKSIDVFENIQELLEVSDVSLTVKGTSMWPFFNAFNTKVKLTKVKEIKKGNIYLFKNNETFVLHRLIKIKEDLLIFKGDGNTKEEVINQKFLIAELVSYINKKNKEISVNNKSYKFKSFLYRLLPRRIVIKLFKNKNDK